MESSYYDYGDYGGGPSPPPIPDFEGELLDDVYSQHHLDPETHHDTYSAAEE